MSYNQIKNNNFILKYIKFILLMLVLILTLFNVNEVKADDNVTEFNYTGNIQTFTVPETGYYKLETWGASGGDAVSKYDGTIYKGGYGAYSSGYVFLNKNDILYIVVGGAGKTNTGNCSLVNGGYNGGGSLIGNSSDIQYNWCSAYSTGTGGGATHIALDSGLLSSLSSHKTDGRILIVSGGGGGASVFYWSDNGTLRYSSGGSGGGIKGGLLYNNYNNPYSDTTTPGTQTESGSGLLIGNPAAFGVGQVSEAGGGGGYYGGGASIGGTGGSGYIASSKLMSLNDNKKHMTCYNCESSEDENVNTISNTCYDSTATEDCSKSGNGFAKITKLAASNENRIKNIIISRGDLTPDFDPNTNEYNLKVNFDVDKINITTEKIDERTLITGDGEINIKNVDSKDIEIISTSESGLINIYTIHLSKYQNTTHSSKLKELSLKNYPQLISFSSETYEYNVDIIDDYELPIEFEKYDSDATVTIQGNTFNSVRKNTSGLISIKVEAPECEDTIYFISWSKKGLVKSFDYNGSVQTYEIPYDGKYKLETWGAQGGAGNTSGGFGGYAVGDINLSKNQVLYIAIGGQGKTGSTADSVIEGGFNGGGSGKTADSSGDNKVGSGGGATHISLEDGLLKTLSNKIDKILIVAGGGGGSAYYKNTTTYYHYGSGGSGGGYIGNSSSNSYSSQVAVVTAPGGKQESTNSNNEKIFDGSFGQGADNQSYGSGGGGGYYGGSTAYYLEGAAGGSGYIGNSLLSNKNMTCYNCSTSTTDSTKTQSSSTYSTTATAGTPKSGNGYARITLLSNNNTDNYLLTLESNQGQLSPTFDSEITNYTLSVDSNLNEVTLSGTLSNENSIVSGLGKITLDNFSKQHNVSVTAQDGSIRTYTINIVKSTHSSYLKKLSINNVSNAFTFDPETLSYSINITADTYYLDIKYSTIDPTANVEITGADFRSVRLNDSGTVNIKVSAPECSDNTYKINWTKQTQTLGNYGSYTFYYTGSYQTFTIPYTGKYQLEVWGAAGGAGNGGAGYGGYETGITKFKKGDKLYVYCGGQGASVTGKGSGTSNATVSGGWNGGGDGSLCNQTKSKTGGGGGATDIRVNSTDLHYRVIVGGGGGGGNNKSGSAGGNSNTSGSGTNAGGAGTQTSGGLGGINKSESYRSQSGGFGYGGNGYKGSSDSRDIANAGGGGGWYGGGGGGGNRKDYANSGATTSGTGGGGGGSSYAHTNSNSASYLGASYIMTNISSSNAANSGSGYAKITAKTQASNDNYLLNLETNLGYFDKKFDPLVEEYNLILGPYDENFTLSGTLSSEDATVSGLGSYTTDYSLETVLVSVTAGNGEVRVYRINIVKDLPEDASIRLKKLSVKDFDISPTFKSLTEQYYVTVASSTMHVDVEAVPIDKNAEVTIKGNGYLPAAKKNVITITVKKEGVGETTYKINVQKEGVVETTRYVFDCGSVQTFTTPATSVYNFEAWGASGGRGYSDGKKRNGGYGAYTSGKMRLKKDLTFYIVPGCKGGNANRTTKKGGAAGWNGGGAGQKDKNKDNRAEPSGGGGGASDIRLAYTSLTDEESLRSRIMVAAGGGGGAYDGHGESGGTISTSTASQTSGYRFGVGQDGEIANGPSAGAGGGYFGGTTGIKKTPGGGGSSYVSGCSGCKSIALDTPLYLFSDDPNHQSGYVFDSISMISGGNTMPSYDYGYIYGNEGDGKVVITMERDRSSDNFLREITVDKGELSPVFDIEQMDYSVNLEHDDTEITISAKTSDDIATISGVGTFDVPAGTTVFPIVVTAENGEIRTYTVTVTREKSSNSKPKLIEVSGLVPTLCLLKDEYCVVEPEFDPETNEYSLTVPAKIKQLEFTVIKGNKFQTINGDGVVTLVSGLNEFEVVVTSEDETSTSSYKFNITRDMAGNNNIEELNVVTPPVNINFNPDITEYYFSIPNIYDNLELDITLEDDKASYDVIGNENFIVGLNVVIIRVTAANGDIKDYILNVYKEKSGNTFLNSLIVKHVNTFYDLTPEFNKFITNYTVNVPNDVDEILIEATAEHSLTTVNGDGIKTLSTGLNTFDVLTTSDNGDTEIYKLNILRAKNSDATLSLLSVQEGEITPEFNKDIDTYEINVDSNIDGLTISADTTVSTSSYIIKNNKGFVAGENVVTIEVTAEDGTKKYYFIKVNRTASTNNYLKSLNTDRYDLTEEFDKEVQEYSIILENEVKNITIEAETEDKHSKINGLGTYILKTGDNEIDIDVKSESGDYRTYTLNVYRKLNENAYLSNIEITPEKELLPIFDKDTDSYTINVDNLTKSINIKGIPEISTTTVFGNGDYNLSVGNNNITLKTTSESGNIKEYLVNVIRAKSNNANLEKLNVREGLIEPTFNKDILDYEVKVLYNVQNITIDYKTENEGATVEIIGNQNLTLGDNEVTVKVTSEDHTEIKEYKINVIKQEEGTTSSKLKSLIISEGTLTPEFNGDILNYEVEVPFDVDNIVLEGQTEDVNATVTGLGEYNLNVGENNIPVRVTSTEGIIRTYQVNVIRDENADARLSNVDVKGSLLTPSFDKDTYSYSLSTQKYSLDMQITPLIEGATYEVLGNENFVLGENTVTIRVTAKDGHTQKDYILNVTKEKSGNNNLSSLEVEGYEISPEFNKNTTVYYLTVDRNIINVNIDAKTEDPYATIDGIGFNNLSVGENEIEIIVTAENGKEKIYTILITRTPKDNNYLKEIKLSEGTLSPVFNKGTLDYEVTIPYEEETITITATPEDEDATVLGQGKYNLNVGSNNITLAVISEGGTNRIYNINVIREEIISSKIKSLEVQDYEIEPKFNSDLYEYNVTVDNLVTSINTIIEKVDKDATVNITGNSNFIVGFNTVLIEVTDRKGISTSTYKLNVNRQNYANTYLSYLDVSKGSLNPVFNRDTLSYEVLLPNNEEKITIFGDVEDEKNTLTGIGTYNLNYGDNKIPITVTTPKGIKRVYYVNVVRALRDDNYLLTFQAKVNFENQTLTPVFDKETENYTLTVPAGTTIVTLSGSSSEASTIEGLGDRDVVIGTNSYDISVTSESGLVKTYNLTVTRPASSENHLIDLVPSSGALSPAFTYINNTYSLKLDSTTSFLSFDYVLMDQFSTVTGTESQIVPDGDSTREIKVKAEDGTINTYTVNITKEKTDEARLKTLSVEGYSLDKTFNSDIFEYTITVPNSKNILYQSEVKATTIDSLSTMVKDSSLELSTINHNKYKIRVTSKDNSVTNIYTINVIREKSSEALLDDISTSLGRLSPAFSSNVLTYTLYVNKGVNVIHSSDIIAIATKEDATIEKTSSVKVSYDEKLFTIKVTSGDGTSSKTYNLNVRYEINDEASFDTLTTDIGFWDKEFNKDDYEYTINVSIEDEEINISGTPSPKATVLTDLGKFNLTEDETTINIGVRAENGTEKEYILTIVKSIPIDTSLEDLYLSGKCNKETCLLSPEFDKDTYSYDVILEEEYDQVEIAYVKSYNEQIVRFFNEDNEPISNSLNLKKGNTTVRIEVENTLGRKNNYYMNIYRQDSGNNYLSDLAIQNPITDKTIFLFRRDIMEYDAVVDYEIENVEIRAIKEDAGATVRISGSTGLHVGNNDVLVSVQARNGDVRDYIIHVYREDEFNSNLESITVSSGVIYNLKPKFKKGVYDYSTTVPYKVSMVNIDAVPEVETTKVLGTGEKDLVIGFNKYNLVSTSAEGTVSIFQITINRLKPTTLYLKSLNIAEGETSPIFSKEIFKYDVEIPSEVNKLTIDAIPEDADVSVKIVGNNNLTSGKNTIYIVLTSSDNSVTTSYVLEVNKGISENKDLLKILLDKTELEGFNKDITEYEKEYEYNKEKVEVEGILEDKNAKIEGNGIYSLEEGNNEVKLTVTSENGETKVYTINIVRKCNTYLKDIVTDRGRLVPSFNKETNNYEIEVENEIKDITVIGLPESSDAEVEGNNKYDLTVGNNEVLLKVKNHGYEKDYNIVVKRKANSNTNLKYLLVSEGILDKEYSNEINEYEVHVPSDIRSISLSYEPEVETTRVEEIGNNLTENEQYVTLKVIASDNTERDIRIKVIKDEEPLYSNKLLDLKVDKGELSPAFDPDIQEYTVTVPSMAKEIQVTAVKRGTQTVEGVGLVKLDERRTVHQVKVTSKDGKTRIYTLIIYKESSNDARLEKLEFNEGYLTPIFNSDVYNYTLTCDPETALVTIKEIKTIDENASYEVTGGEIKNGTSLIQIKVTSADKTNSKTYKILAKLAKSSNAYLKDITLSAGELNPAFNKEINTYQVEVESNVEDIIIKGIPESTKAYVTGNTKYELEYGKNYVNIIVTAEAGNTNVYSIVIERKQSDNTYLKDLSVKGYEISPEFDKEELNYELEVDYFVTKVEILGEAEDPLSRVMGLGEKDLKEGNNLFSIIVTSQTGDIREYKINILRNRLISSKLLDLDIKEGVLSPEFNKSIEYYTTEIPYEYTKVTEIVELEDKNASYEVIGNNDLQVGENEVDIVVTSSDNKEVTTYHLLVRRNVLTNNYLESLEVSEGRLTPVFDKNIVYYEVEVDNLIETIEVTARPESISTEVRGNGEYNLEVGKNKIIIESTGQNGITRYTKVIVTRKHEENNYLLDIIPSVGVLNPAFIKSHEMYEVEVPVGTTEISFEVVKESEKSTVTGDGTHQIQGGENQVDILVTSEKGEVRVYSINVIRPLDNNTNIVSITPSTSEIEPEYNNEVYEYSIKVDKDTNILDLEVELESPLAKVSGNKGIIVDELLKTVTITVTAEDGTIREVEITIEKESSLIDIEVEENDVIIMKGDTYQIKANTVPEGRRLTYTAEDTEIINVSEEGSVFGLKEGTTKVKVTSPENEYLEKEVQITVLSDKLESDIYSVEDREYRIVIGSEPQTTVKDYKLNLKNRYEHIKIYDKDGNELSEETSVGTGLIIKLEFNGKVYDEATIVVRGDIDGDSIVNVSDYMIALNHAIESEFIEDMIQFYAADVDPTDTVNVTDYLKIMDYALDPENAESLN